jgi:DNA-binding transcriptional regulator YiaG
MPTVRPSKADLVQARQETDWRRLDAQTDAEIEQAIREDPDAAPDLSAELRAGCFRRVDPTSDEVDVVAIRARTGLSQRAFAERFGLELRAVQDWEQGRRKPTRSVASYLKVIDRAPDLVAQVLAG